MLYTAWNSFKFNKFSMRQGNNCKTDALVLALRQIANHCADNDGAAVKSLLQYCFSNVCLPPKYPRGKLSAANCLRQVAPRQIVPAANCPRGKLSSRQVVRGKLSGGKLSGGKLSVHRYWAPLPSHLFEKKTSNNFNKDMCIL